MSGISFNPEANPQKTQKTQNTNYVLTNRTTGEKIVMNGDVGNILKAGPQEELKQCIDASILPSNMPSPDVLKTKGFKEADHYDMNGGHYFNNAITGDKVRVNSSWGNSGNKCYEFTRGNMCHSVIYDKNGHALRGDVQIKQNGMIKTIEYDIDAQGNTVIKSIKVIKTENFLTHDGSY